MSKTLKSAPAITASVVNPKSINSSNRLLLSLSKQIIKVRNAANKGMASK